MDSRQNNQDHRNHYHNKQQNYFQLVRQSNQPKQLLQQHQAQITNTKPNQLFSSRNALRSAQFLTTKQTTTTPPKLGYTTSSTSPLRLGFSKILAKMIANGNNVPALDGTYVPDQDSYENYDYVPLDSEAFLRPVGGYLYCLLCGIRQRAADEVSIDDHLISSYHVDCYDKLRSLLVGQIPDDNSLQMSSVKQLINKWLLIIDPTAITYYTRYSIANELNNIISLINPSCSVRVIGSLACGTMLNTSNINLELLHPNSSLFESDPRAKNSVHHLLVDPDASFGNQINYHTLHYDLAPNAFETLYNIGRTISETRYPPIENSFQLISTFSDLNRKVPKLTLKHTPTNTIVELCCYVGSGHRLTNLLKLYMGLDIRARLLSLIVKNWAKVCGISNPDDGSYPPETYVILVIYFLQRTTPPVLPCIHEWAQASKSKNDKEAPPSSTNNFDDGSLSRPRSSTIESNGSTHIEPTTTVNGTMVEVEEESGDEDEDDEGFLNLDNPEAELEFSWSSENTESIEKLFIRFLKHMHLEFSNINNIITIRTLRNIHPSNRSWNASNIKSIEHPIKPKVNISRGIGSQRTFDYIRNCFRYGFYYLTSIPVSRRLSPKNEHESDPRDYIDFYINTSRLEFYFEIKEVSLRSSTRQETIEEMISQRLFARDIEIISILIKAQPDLGQLPTIVANMYQDELLRPKDLDAIRYCHYCRGNGHLRIKCPKFKLIRLTNAEASVDHTALDANAKFCQTLLTIYWSSRVQPVLANEHNLILKELKEIINSKTGLKCKLQLYGSTVNRMGSSDSDLDICMVLEDNETGKGLDFARILTSVKRILVDDRRVNDMEAILSARVPILKFKYKIYEIDLSMYNQCALYNSKLLKAYVDIDERTSQLFCVVKRMAKSCGIADATKGSLSSYAWALLVIHYLQRLYPPILPVLQEVKRGMSKPTVGVNGWNVWFSEDRVKMEPYNTMTMTQLFKGFYRYYSVFNFNTSVVTIRTSEALTRFRKNWNDCTMAIEDPFELTYNLASRLDEQMGIYIINSFAYIYKHIVKLQEAYSLRRSQAILDGILDGGLIMPSLPPYRGCRVCYRIGHRVRNCPEMKGLKRSVRGGRRSHKSNSSK